MITAEHFRDLGLVSGNFWSTYLDPASKLVFARMRDTMATAGLDAGIQAIAESFAGNTAVTGPRVIPFPAEKVIRIGATLNTFRDGADVFDGGPAGALEFEGGAAAGRPSVSPSSGQQGISYLTPIPANCVPLILIGKRLLMVGVDFRLQGGYLETFESPHNLFPLDGIVVWREQELRRNPAGYSFGTDGVDVAAVANYCKYDQSPSSFLRAACAAAGLWEVQEYCTILARSNNSYVTDRGRIPIRYRHAYLSVGDTLQAGQFIGATPGFSDLADPGFSAGLPLQGLTPCNVTVPAGVIRVDVDGSVLLPYVEGHPDEVSRYHNYIRNNSTAWEVDPVAALDYPSPSVQYLDWLDLINRELVGAGVWVVNLGAENLDVRLQMRMRRWMRENRPLGRALLFTTPDPSSNLTRDFNEVLLVQDAPDYFRNAVASGSGEVSLLLPGEPGGFLLETPAGDHVELPDGLTIQLPGDFDALAAETAALDMGNDSGVDFYPTPLHNIFALPHLP